MDMVYWKGRWPWDTRGGGWSWGARRVDEHGVLGEGDGQG